MTDSDVHGTRIEEEEDGVKWLAQWRGFMHSNKLKYAALRVRLKVA